MQRILFSSVLVATAITLATPHTVLAQPGSAAMFAEPTETVSPPKRESYRAQIALAGAGSIGMLVAGFAGESEPLIGAGFVALTVGPALVHAANGNSSVAVKSFGIHLLLPSVMWGAGFIVGVESGPGDGGFEQLAWGALGGMVGMGAGIVGSYVYDLLSANQPSAAKPGDRMIAPTVVPRDGGATFGVVGGF